ncbi:MAG: anaerobic sulfatase maturase [Elusimicrobia bacterium RIFOXYA2_FULL_39_19]|nr:MAG: anaerobic sulfatase maturase [Elusimicrobia bacterium RIFOXYA2_FULL_39_19]
MKPFTLLIKPTSSDCNLNCKHCFYIDKKFLYPQTNCHKMPEIILEKMISSYMATEQPQYIFGWQGGEPTLLGIDFFRKALSLAEKYGKRGAVAGNTLQTNGKLLNDEFAQLFFKYNFLIGVSLDGPKEIHDHYRKTVDGRGSHADALKGIECLKRNNVEFNILTLVTSANVTKAKEIYHYLCDNGFLFHQYIPCVEFDTQANLKPFAISGRQWGNFLCEIFDEWLKKDTKKVSVRLFDSILTYMINGTYNVCNMQSNCCSYFIVEHNGDIYPCDFFVEENRKLGNIMNNSWDELMNSEKYLSFGKQKLLWNDACAICPYIKFCAGDCLKHRLFENNNPKKLSWLCEGWKQFYAHALPALKELAITIKKEMGPAQEVSK